MKFQNQLLAAAEAWPSDLRRKLVIDHAERLPTRRVFEGLPRVLVKHFRVEDPGGTVPTRSVKGRPQVEEEDGSNTTTVELTSRGP